jgi:hypothetical protein
VADDPAEPPLVDGHVVEQRRQLDIEVAQCVQVDRRDELAPVAEVGVHQRARHACGLGHLVEPHRRRVAPPEHLGGDGDDLRPALGRFEARPADGRRFGGSGIHRRHGPN